MMYNATFDNSIITVEILTAGLGSKSLSFTYDLEKFCEGYNIVIHMGVDVSNVTSEIAMMMLDKYMDTSQDRATMVADLRIALPVSMDASNKTSYTPLYCKTKRGITTIKIWVA